MRRDSGLESKHRSVRNCRFDSHKLEFSPDLPGTGCAAVGAEPALAAKEVARKVEELARVTGEILSEKFAELKDQSGPAKDRAEQELRDFAAKAEEAVGKATSGSKPV